VSCLCKAESDFPSKPDMKISVLLAACFTSSCAWEAEVDSALLKDDQCVGEEGCVLHALQVKSSKGEAEKMDADEELEIEAEDEEELEWLKDISIKQKNHFKHILSPLQKPIVAEYKSLSVLNKYAGYVMAKIENATGQEVLWNKKASLLQDEEEELDELATTGRRRHHGHGSQSLPPRARYVNKILIYLEKEMKAVWNLHTIVDRKRWGAGDRITSSPYGPHGEHPDNWEPNGSFPMPLVTPPLNSTTDEVHVPKVHEAEYKSKYAEQLQEDYVALVQNIIDANKKTNLLRKALGNMNGYADTFASEESGVFNRIETQ